jgi:hypothetical protein
VGRPPFDVGAFLDEEGRMAQVASVSASQVPLLGSLWFLFERSRFWFSSASSSPLPRAAERGGEVAVIVDDFRPPDSIRQVRIRGRGQVEPPDPDLVGRIYERYLGRSRASWPPFFRSRAHTTEGWTLWSVSPLSGMVVTSPGFSENVYRWETLEQAPFA